MHRRENGQNRQQTNIHVNLVEANSREVERIATKREKQQIKIPREQPTSSSSQISSSSSSSRTPSPLPEIKNPSEKAPLNWQRSLSNMSLSSRYSYDNINDGEEYSYDIHGKQKKPVSTKSTELHQTGSAMVLRSNSDVQADTNSTNSAMTLRTESYRQAHPLHSFAFDYPKRSTPNSSNLNKPNPCNNIKQYEISV